MKSRLRNPRLGNSPFRFGKRMKFWQLTVVVIALNSAGAQPADGHRGVLYVPEIGALKSTRDGQLTAIEIGTARPLATNRTGIANVDMQGHLSDGTTPHQFPTPPLFRNDLATDNQAGTFNASSRIWAPRIAPEQRRVATAQEIKGNARTIQVVWRTRPPRTPRDGIEHPRREDRSLGPKKTAR